MPLSLKRGRVTAILERHEGLARIEVDGAPAVAYPRLTGPVAIGDDVLVNVQARALGLGSGGFDVLHANLTRGLGLDAVAGAHVMKLPYTPLQAAVRHAEEDGPLALTLDGLPVVCCSLHGQVAPVCAALRGLRIAYIQVPGGALPVPLSDTVRALDVTSVAVGACVDGDLACVSIASGLLWAKGNGFDVAVCSVGPGIVGTASPFGHGATAAAEAANAASALGGRAVIAARVSGADERPRHRGVSHHTRAVLTLVLADAVVGWPAGTAAPGWLEPRVEVDTSGWREACAGLPLSHMGRGPDGDPTFFEAAYAAGLAARTRTSTSSAAGPES